MAPGGASERPRQSAYPPPPRRRLRVFSLDPTHSRRAGTTAVMSIPWEPLRAGPDGSRIRVLDWQPDGTLVPGVDLDDPHLLAQDGLVPDESDPQFRQQQVYAVLSSLLESIDLARGRRLVWRNVWRDSPEGPGERPMPVFPHGLRAANAQYAPGQGLSFGSFNAVEDPVGLFPGQWVHGCLSHDIVNHEAGHAFLHELRPLSLQPGGLDAAAFHEGFADILAILRHFSLPGLLESQVAKSGTRIWDPGPFVQLAGEFGRGSGKESAVRDFLAEEQPTPYTATTEPHARGAVLAAALFEAFFASYTRRITPLLRVAGLRADATMLPRSLIDLVCQEARAAAATVLAMAIRAVDYLPPIGITFRTFLDAVIAADTDLSPEDRDGFRRSFVEACRRRGIYPTLLPGAIEEEQPGRIEPLPTRQPLLMATHDLGRHSDPVRGAARSSAQLDRSWRADLLTWGRTHAGVLGLVAENLEVDGGNASFRVDEDGFPTAVVTARFTARNLAGEAGLPESAAGLRLIGGVTVIAEGNGSVHHVVRTPVPGQGADGAARLEELVEESGRTALAMLDCVAAASAVPLVRAPAESSIPGPRRVARKVAR